MRSPRHSDVRDVPLDTDEALLERVGALLERAFRRELWLLFLDERGCQLPVLTPIDVPRRPGRRDAPRLAEFLGELVEAVEAAELAVVYERRGRDLFSADDRAWLALVTEACALAGVALRGPILLHDGGVRWVAREDLDVTML